MVTKIIILQNYSGEWAWSDLPETDSMGVI